ncbi:MAG: cache domain-containing protein, partial [Pseudanabaena sp. ELA748]
MSNIFQQRSPVLKSFSLQSAIVVPFVALIVGAVGVVGYLSYRSGQESVENLAKQLMLNVGDRTKQNLDSYFAIPKSVALTDAALLRQKRLDGYDLDMMSQHFVQQINIFPRLSGISIANENGDFFSIEKPVEKSLTIRKRNVTSGDKYFYRYIADQDGKSPILQETRTNYNPHNDTPSNPWYTQAKNEPNGVWRLGVSLAQGQDKPILYTAYFLPFYNIAGQFQGVLSSAIYLTHIGDFLRNLNISKNGQIFLIERNGLLVATSTDEVPFDQTNRNTLAENVNTRHHRLPALQSQNPLTAATVQLLSKQPLELSQIKQPQHLRVWLNDTQYFVEVTP